MTTARFVESVSRQPAAGLADTDLPMLGTGELWFTDARSPQAIQAVRSGVIWSHLHEMPVSLLWPSGELVMAHCIRCQNLHPAMWLLPTDAGLACTHDAKELPAWHHGLS